MLAFTNTLRTHAETLAEMRAHIAADELVKGRYWQDGKGCAVGCMTKSSDHSLYEPMFGIPKMIAGLEDCIFERLENGEAKAWPIQFLEAIRPGADLSLVAPKFMHWMLVDPEHGVARFNNDASIINVARLWQRVVDGDMPTSEDWSAWSARSARSAWSAWSAAWSAAESAAWSARSAAESAAWSARSAWSAARSAAWSAARSAAWSAAESAAESAARSAESAAESARSAAYRAMRDKLLELLAAAPVPA